MSTVCETSDAQVLELLRRQGAMSIAQLVEAQQVTANAVRQRLNRLMGQGLIERRAEKTGRGRPGHVYELTAKAQQQSPNNFGDLATVLWQELRHVRDPEIRRGMLKRIAASMASIYSNRVAGETLAQRMASVRDLLAERGLQFRVEQQPGGLPILSAVDCPYPELAAVDRGICAVEKMVFAELLEDNIRLSQCRYDQDGHACCRFETSTT